MKKVILAFIALLPFALNATHLVGGCFQLQWIGGDNYKLTVRILRDCENGSPDAFFDNPIVVGIFEKGTNNKKQDVSLVFNPAMNDTLKFTGPNCANITTGCTHIATYTKNITLPAAQYGNSNGYYMTWQRCCRNNIINNIVNPNDAAMTLYAEIPSPKFITNNTPIYQNSPNTLLCVNNLFRYNMDFVDADGDELRYSLVDPINGNLDPNTPKSNVPTSGPYPNVIWRNGYDNDHVITGKIPLTINPETGELTCYPEATGVYVASIRVEEYRFGSRIGEVRLELQFTVTNCPNQPPVPMVFTVNNKLINNDTVVVTVPDQICVKIRGVDQTDSVYLHVVTPFSDSLFVNLPQFDSLSFGNRLAETNFCLQTACEHERVGKAFPVFVSLNDNGCPIARNADATFWVRIEPMPLVNPTDLLCMTLVDDKETYFYYGDSTSPTNPYFKQYNIYRGINYSNVQLIDSVRDKLKRLEYDPNTPNYSSINYTYFMVGINKCSRPGPTSDTLGTFEQLKFIPAQQYLKYVSVVENKKLELSWPPTWERDFAKYYLYKSVMGNDGYELVHTFENINDTLFTDADVRVMDTSYCYYLVMRDTCDNIGPMGKLSCSFVLRGTPGNFMNRLNWNSYVGWEAGADMYTVFRSDPVTPFFNAGKTAGELKFTDDKLNIDEGLFHYYIVAHQRPLDGPLFFEAESHSNTIDLVQPPMVYVPNAFTANGDGLNDQFNWVPVFVKDFTMHIYNRWGEEIYSTQDKHAPWNGQYKSQPCQPDVYFYRLSYTGWEGSEKFLVGNFTLLR